MRIVYLYAENVLNLRAVSITPNGRVTRITGKNGAGKSNVLNAMFYALAGKKGHAEQPIRRGEDKAMVRLGLGDREVMLSVILRMTGKGAYLDVESPDGAVFKSPQDMLNKLIGQLTFDPQAFSRMNPEQRLETLRGLVKPAIDIDALDNLNERDRLERTDWNRRGKSMTERVNMLRAQLDPSIDLTPVDISDLTRQMADASEHNAAIERERARRKSLLVDAAKLDAEATEKQERAKALRLEADKLDREAAAMLDRKDAMQAEGLSVDGLGEPIDVGALREQINAASAENGKRAEQARIRDELARAQGEVDEAIKTSRRLSENIETRTKQKEDAIAATKMPIDGLGFGAGDVTFKGLPFDQASTGEQLRIATAIGMALNPKLRVLCVRDGSLLDSDSLAILEQMAEEHDFQLWIESTQEEATTGIHIVDGSVAAVDGVLVSAGAGAE